MYTQLQFLRVEGTETVYTVSVPPVSVPPVSVPPTHRFTRRQLQFLVEHKSACIQFTFESPKCGTEMCRCQY